MLEGRGRDTGAMSEPLPTPPPRFERPPAYRGADTTWQPTGPNTKATAAMICGLVGLALFGPILGVVAIVLGVKARNEIAETGQSGSVQAIAGIVLGVLDIVFNLMLFFLVLN
jgi:hypothetical protein